MSLIIGTGSNVGNRILNLHDAKERLSIDFKFIAESRIYESAAVDYLDQDDFLNQALEFEIPEHLSPDQVMLKILKLEQKLGRDRMVPKGPRTIDIDIIFWGTEKISTDYVITPHPSCFERSFVMKPVQELPFFQTLKNYFTIPTVFSNKADPI